MIYWTVWYQRGCRCHNSFGIVCVVLLYLSNTILFLFFLFLNFDCVNSDDDNSPLLQYASMPNKLTEIVYENGGIDHVL